MLQLKSSWALLVLSRLLSISFIIVQVSCARTLYPVTNGSQIELPEPGAIMVVWGNHLGAVGEAVTTLQQYGFRIVERSRLEQVFDEQKIRLTHTSDDEAQILKIGKLLGADSIIFVDAQTSSGVISQAFAYGYSADARSETVYQASVSVRGVGLESGEVLWSGTAHYSEPVKNLEAGISYLTQSALDRSLCPTSVWSDSSGCDWSKFSGTGVLGFRTRAKEGQLIVTAVEAGSPAEHAGIKVGDELISCNGKSGFRTGMQYTATCRVDAGQPISLEVKRGDKRISISATAVSRTAP